MSLFLRSHGFLSTLRNKCAVNSFVALLQRPTRRLKSTGNTFEGGRMRREKLSLGSLLQLDKIGENRFKARDPRAEARATMFGGELVAQSLSATTKTVPSALRPHSMHCYFTKAGKGGVSVEFDVSRIRDGRSFCTRSVRAIQHGETVLSALVSFHAEEKSAISHLQAKMPAVAPPEDLVDAQTAINDWLNRKGDAANQKREQMIHLDGLITSFEVRPCDIDAYLHLKNTEPRLLLWTRAAGPVGVDDGHAVLAYLSDHNTIKVAMLPHLRSSTYSMFALSLDHSLWFHRRRVRGCEWMLFDMESPIAAAARGFALGRVWSREGELLASFAQESLVRARL